MIRLANRESSQLLARELDDLCTVITQSASGPHLEEFDPSGADLCILDGYALSVGLEVLQTERQRLGQVLLPVLFLSDARGLSSMTRQLWQAVDGVAIRPLDKQELRARVSRLLRMRKLSENLESVSIAHDGSRQVAQEFQKAALPKSLPQIPGLRLDSFYRPGKSEALVGGDWFDALALGNGRLLLSIGDVCGSGLAAAVIMAQVRQCIRGLAQVVQDPVHLLHAANLALQAEHPEALVTAFVGVLDPDTCVLAYASAGHPPPLLVSNGLLAELGSTHTAALGFPVSSARSLEEMHLPPGSTLAFFTDGLTESTRDPLWGEQQVARALQGGEWRDKPNFALALHDLVVGRDAWDDVAVLTLALRSGATNCRHWSVDLSEAQASRDLRRELGQLLAESGLRKDDLDAAEQILGELLANVVQHAPGWADVTLEWSSGRPVLHVQDTGLGFAAPLLHAPALEKEHGRGLWLVSLLARSLQLLPRLNGGCHVRVELPDGRD